MYLDLTSMEGKIVFHCYICYAFSFCAKAGALNKPLGAPPYQQLQLCRVLRPYMSISFHIVKQGPCIQKKMWPARGVKLCNKMQHMNNMNSNASSTLFNHNTHNAHNTGDLVVSLTAIAS